MYSIVRVRPYCMELSMVSLGEPTAVAPKTGIIPPMALLTGYSEHSLDAPYTVTVRVIVTDCTVQSLAAHKFKMHNSIKFLKKIS